MTGAFTLAKNDGEVYNENDLQKLADAVRIVTQNVGLEVTTRVVPTSSKGAHCASGDDADIIDSRQENLAGAIQRKKDRLIGSSNPNEDSAELSISGQKGMAVDPNCRAYSAEAYRPTNATMGNDNDDDVESQTIPRGVSNNLEEDTNDDSVAQCEPPRLYRASPLRRAVSAPGAVACINGTITELPPPPLLAQSSSLVAQSTSEQVLEEPDEEENSENGAPISAVAVDPVKMEREMEEQLRRQITGEAQVASVVVEEKRPNPTTKRSVISVFIAVVFVVSVIISLVARNGANMNDDDGSLELPSALVTVIENDIVRCGLSHKDGFGYVNATTGMHDGFEVDLVRGIDVYSGKALILLFLTTFVFVSLQ